MKVTLKTIEEAEAKAHPYELLDHAATGERIAIAKGGKPMAMLVPLFAS